MFRALYAGEQYTADHTANFTLYMKRQGKTTEENSGKPFAPDNPPSLFFGEPSSSPWHPDAGAVYCTKGRNCGNDRLALSDTLDPSGRP